MAVSRRWEVPRMWEGATVAVISTGPTARNGPVEGARGNPCVVVKSAYLLAPWADLVVAHDLSWWQAHPEALLAGEERVCGQDGAPDCVHYYPVPAERTRLANGSGIEIAGSGFMAIRIAVAAGARRVKLFGFDGGTDHWYDYDEAGMRLTAGNRPANVVDASACALASLTAEFAAAGVEVERFQRSDPYRNVRPTIIDFAPAVPAP